jgi:hypothetical protein
MDRIATNLDDAVPLIPILIRLNGIKSLGNCLILTNNNTHTPQHIMPWIDTYQLICKHMCMVLFRISILESRTLDAVVPMLASQKSSTDSEISMFALKTWINKSKLDYSREH